MNDNHSLSFGNNLVIYLVAEPLLATKAQLHLDLLKPKEIVGGVFLYFRRKKKQCSKTFSDFR